MKESPMKISLKHQSLEKKSSDACVITEHPLEDEMINVAIAKVTGRYPATGNTLNQICKELAYIYEGTGKVVVNSKEQVVKAGDVVLIEPGEKFHWEGNMSIFISCTPAWTKDQNIMVE
jgi:mannose-6-phosphate isomerase-like protein (cupin superfamily)